MPPEATDAPLDHLKISGAIKREILLLMIEQNAFTEQTAISLDELQLDIEKKYAFDKLLHDGEIIQIEKEGQEFYHLSEYYKYTKSYRKQVVQIFSIPLLLFLILLIGAGFITIIYQIVQWFI